VGHMGTPFCMKRSVCCHVPATAGVIGTTTGTGTMTGQTGAMTTGMAYCAVNQVTDCQHQHPACCCLHGGNDALSCQRVWPPSVLPSVLHAQPLLHDRRRSQRVAIMLSVTALWGWLRIVVSGTVTAITTVTGAAAGAAAAAGALPAAAAGALLRAALCVAAAGVQALPRGVLTGEASMQLQLVFAMVLAALTLLRCSTAGMFQRQNSRWQNGIQKDVVHVDFILHPQP